MPDIVIPRGLYSPTGLYAPGDVFFTESGASYLAVQSFGPTSNGEPDPINYVLLTPSRPVPADPRLGQTATALRRVRSGSGFMRIGLFGTSLTRGKSLSVTGSCVGAKALSVGRLLRDALNNAGINASDESAVGNGNINESSSISIGNDRLYGAYDPRFGIPNTWNADEASSPYIPGGIPIANVSVASGTPTFTRDSLTLTPSLDAKANRVEITTVRGNGSSFGTAKVYYTHDGTDHYMDTISSVSSTADFHTFRFDTTNQEVASKFSITPDYLSGSNGPAGQIIIARIAVYDSTKTAALIDDLSISSGKASTYLNESYGLPQFLAAQYEPYDLAIVELGENEMLDTSAPVTPTAFDVDLRQVMGALLKTGSDVLLVTGSQPNPTISPLVDSWARYRYQMGQVAGSAIPMVDPGGQAGKYSDASAAGLLSSDGVHWTATGARLVARLVREAVLGD